jgi:hypothetical protein
VEAPTDTRNRRGIDIFKPTRTRAARVTPTPCHQTIPTKQKKKLEHQQQHRDHPLEHSFSSFVIFSSIFLLHNSLSLSRAYYNLTFCLAFVVIYNSKHV